MNEHDKTQALKDFKRIAELVAENERLKAELACPPGGWIDQLRVRALQAEAELAALKRKYEWMLERAIDGWADELDPSGIHYPANKRLRVELESRWSARQDGES
jgi:hypothetical protein